MGLSFDLLVRVVRGRVVLKLEGKPDEIIGRVVSCPCCGAEFVEVACPS